MLSKSQGKGAWFPRLNRNPLTLRFQVIFSLVFHLLNFSDHRLAGIQSRDDNLCNCETIAYFVIEVSILVSKYTFLLNLLRWMVIFSNLKRWPVGKLLIILNLFKNSRKETEETLFQLSLSEQLKSPLINSGFITMVGFIRTFYGCAPQRKGGFILCRNL